MNYFILTLIYFILYNNVKEQGGWYGQFEAGYCIW